jgi:hypothetical protein
MTNASFLPTQNRRSGWAVPGANPLRAGACAVRLVDRRTGQTHRINGSPLILFTQRPEEAATELLAGRDPLVWEARIEPLGSEGDR